MTELSERFTRRPYDLLQRAFDLRRDVTERPVLVCPEVLTYLESRGGVPPILARVKSIDEYAMLHRFQCVEGLLAEDPFDAAPDERCDLCRINHATGARAWGIKTAELSFVGAADGQLASFPVVNKVEVVDPSLLHVCKGCSDWLDHPLTAQHAVAMQQRIADGRLFFNRATFDPNRTDICARHPAAGIIGAEHEARANHPNRCEVCKRPVRERYLLIGPFIGEKARVRSTKETIPAIHLETRFIDGEAYVREIDNTEIRKVYKLEHPSFWLRHAGPCLCDEHLSG